jgi:hypothetical protein
MNYRRLATIPGIGEQRLFAFELRRWEAQLGVPASRQDACAGRNCRDFSAQYGAATTQTPRRPRGWIFCDDISEFTLAQFLLGGR